MRRPIALLLSAALALSSLSVLAQTAPQLAGLSGADYVLSKQGSTYLLKSGRTGAVTTASSPGTLLQEAATACPSSGCVIRLSAETFSLTATLWLKSGTTLEGAGMGVTILQRAAGTVTDSNAYKETPVIAFGPSVGHYYTYTTNPDETTIAGANPGSNFAIRNLTIDGNAANQTITTEKQAFGISGSIYVADAEFGGYDNVTIENVEIKNTKASSIRLDATKNVRITGCYLHDFGSLGVSGSKNGITVSARAGAITSGWGTGLEVTNNKIVGYSPNTGSMEGIVPVNISNVRIIGNEITAVEFAVELGTTSTITSISDYVISDNNIHDSVANTSGYGITAGSLLKPLYGLTISGNTITNMGRSGINLGDARNVSITGNTIYNTGSSATGGSTGTGIALSGSDDFSVIGNTVIVAATNSYGIVINSSSTNGIVSSNYIEAADGATFAVSLCCSSTNITIANNTINCVTTGRGLATRSTATGSVFGNNLLSCADGVFDDSSGTVTHLAGLLGHDYQGLLSPATLSAERTWTLPNMTGTALMSTLSTNNQDAANSVWAESNGLVFEGTADGSETTLTATDPTADRTITLPDASGTAALVTGSSTEVTYRASATANGAATSALVDTTSGALTNPDGQKWQRIAEARAHASLYGDPNFYTKPSFVDLWGEFWRGQPMRFDADNGNSNYEDPVFSISQCPANSPSSGSCTSTTGIDYVCISAIDTDSDSTNELAVGDPVIFIGSAASSAVATPTGQVYYVFTIGNGAGSGTDCPSGTNNKITLRPRPNYVTEGINATGSKMTTLWHHPYHPGYAGSYLMGYKLAYAPRSVYGAQGRNLLANGSLHFNATTPTGWTVSSFTPVGAQFQATPTVATTYQCYEGEAGTAPYSCIAGPNPCTSGGYIRQGPITVEPGVQYVVGGYITTYSTDILGVYVDVNGDSTLEALESTTFAFDATLFNTFWGLPRLYWRTVTIPATANQAWVQYTHGASCQANIPSLDNFFFRRLTTRVGDDVLGSVGTYLIGDPGTRKIVVAGDSWIYDDGTDYSNGNKFCDGLRAGMAARLGRNIDSQIICEGRSGETTNDLLTGTTCTDSTPTGGAYNCWDRQVARHDPLYLVVNLGTNDVRTSVTAATYVANMLEIGTRAQSIGAIPIVLSPSPIINDIADYTHYVTAHSYYTLLKHAVLDDVP